MQHFKINCCILLNFYTYILTKNRAVHNAPLCPKYYENKKIKLTILEIYFCIIVAALKELLHLFLTWLTWVRTCTSIADCISCYFWELSKEFIFWNNSLFCWKTTFAIVLNALWNIKLIIHLTKHCD